MLSLANRLMDLYKIIVLVLFEKLKKTTRNNFNLQLGPNAKLHNRSLGKMNILSESSFSMHSFLFGNGAGEDHVNRLRVVKKRKKGKKSEKKKMKSSKAMVSNWKLIRQYVNVALFV